MQIGDGKDTVGKKTYAILTLSVIAIFILTTVVFVIYSQALQIKEYTNNLDLYNWHFWLTLCFAIVIFLYILILLFRALQLGIVFNPKNLYFIFAVIAILFCSIINFTGGLTNSPFTALYSGLMTLTFFVYEDIFAVKFSAVTIVLCLVLNTTLQFLGIVTNINTNTIWYNILYALVIIGLFIFLSIVDFKSKKKERNQTK